MPKTGVIEKASYKNAVFPHWLKLITAKALKLRSEQKNLKRSFNKSLFAAYLNLFFMTPRFTKSLSSRIEDEIKLEIGNYVEALKMDAEFEVLKKIRYKIKMLEDQLKNQRGIKVVPRDL